MRDELDPKPEVKSEETVVAPTPEGEAALKAAGGDNGTEPVAEEESGAEAGEEGAPAEEAVQE